MQTKLYIYLMTGQERSKNSRSCKGNSNANSSVHHILLSLLL